MSDKQLTGIMYKGTENNKGFIHDKFITRHKMHE